MSRRRARGALAGRSDRNVEATAVEQLDRVILGVVLAARAMSAAQSLLSIASVRRLVRDRAVLFAALVAISGESAWAIRRMVRQKSAEDGTVAWADMAVANVALLGEAASWHTRRLPPDPRWSQVYGLLTAAWTSFGNGDLQLSARASASWAATYAVATKNQALDRGGVSVRGQRYSEMAGGVAFSSIGAQLGRGLRLQAAELDAARADAVEQAERNAAELERVNQHRILHDSALQILETVAGSWNVDRELLERRIDFEIDRLTRVLSGGGLAPEGGLPEAMDALKNEFALIGLEVAVESGDGAVACSRSAVEVLNDAAHEALMNVHKHAGTRSATLRAFALDGDVGLEIRDSGHGFDVDAPRRGFGVTESVQRRMADAGGSVQITSTPGSGTVVVLRMAAVRMT